MTSADFIAACFWPLIVIFALLLKFVGMPDLRRWVARLAIAATALYFILWAAYSETSLIGVVDSYVFGVVAGIGMIWFGYNRLRHPSRDPNQPPWKAAVAALAGILFALTCGFALFGDFTQPHIVLEGRVTNVRTQGSRHTTYVVDIAGRTVKVTIPVYERLKFLPVVRAEVGRGSNYVYRIEYLAN
jgi:hypothetical protein